MKLIRFAWNLTWGSIVLVLIILLSPLWSFGILVWFARESILNHQWDQFCNWMVNDWMFFDRR